MKDNFPQAYDMDLAQQGRRHLRRREHVPSGRFNAGEKSWFWARVVTLLGIVSVRDGLGNAVSRTSTRGAALMQHANVIHAVSAMLFITMALGHIYLGTIGVEGAYETMRTGMVDEIWAKEHHEYWYKEVIKGRPGAAGSASAARAGAMKEGWKL